MIKSIQHFEENGIKKIEDIFLDFSKDTSKFAEMIAGITKCLFQFGCDMITEELEAYDTFLREDNSRKRNWYIVRKDSTSLLTTLGTITYQKTLFQNKHTGERTYLLDRIMNLEKHARMTEDTVVRILTEAANSCYRKSGEQASFTEDHVSKQAVMKKIHKLKFPEPPLNASKKSVSYLYIDADEDHIPLQFFEQKGDLKGKQGDRRKTSLITKLVYVYEGIAEEYPGSKRRVLINPRYFSGVYQGRKKNAQLWDEVYNYIQQNYDTEHLEKIYLNADGGPWIKTGENRISEVIYVIDEFHLKQHLYKATSHMGDLRLAMQEELKIAIKSGLKGNFRNVVKRILETTTNEKTVKSIKDSEKYLISNWEKIQRRLFEKDHLIGCSAEGHVSHVLSARMSSRPMGWSISGADKMAHLRAYVWNGGDMLDLVRFQQQDLPEVVGMERISSAAYILEAEHKFQREMGNYSGMHVYSIPFLNVKKKLYLKNHIWGL